MHPSWKQRSRRPLLADIVDPLKRSEMMAGIRAKDTKPELVVRRLLHSLGYRFRLHRKDLPGKPDIVLPKWHTVIFVHGCFWHGHENCQLFRPPKTRTEFWTEKVNTNKKRDVAVQAAYSTLGWRVIVVWECTFKGKFKLDPREVGIKLTDFLNRGPSAKMVIRGQATA